MGKERKLNTPVFKWVSDTVKNVSKLCKEENDIIFCLETQTMWKIKDWKLVDTKDIFLPSVRGNPWENWIDWKDGKDWEQWRNGRDWYDGKDGANGVDGNPWRDGKDGIDGKDWKDWIDWKDGENWKDGKDGEKGEKWEKMTLSDISRDDLQWVLQGLIPLIRDMLPRGPKGDSFTTDMSKEQRLEFRNFLNDLQKETFEETKKANETKTRKDMITVQYSKDGNTDRHEEFSKWDLWMRNVVGGLSKEPFLLHK